MLLVGIGYYSVLSNVLGHALMLSVTTYVNRHGGLAEGQFIFKSVAASTKLRKTFERLEILAHVECRLCVQNTGKT